MPPPQLEMGVNTPLRKEQDDGILYEMRKCRLSFWSQYRMGRLVVCEPWRVQQEPEANLLLMAGQQ